MTKWIATNDYQIKDVSKFQDGSIRSIELSGGPAHVNGGTIYAVPHAQYSDMAQTVYDMLIALNHPNNADAVKAMRGFRFTDAKAKLEAMVGFDGDPSDVD
jgi:hypothetical protein